MPFCGISVISPEIHIIESEVLAKEKFSLPIQRRTATIVPGSANEEKHTIEVVWTTGAKVRRYDWMTSHPLPGAEAVTVFLSGNREHAICLAVDDRRYRIQGLKGGEVAIYTDENDQGSGHRIVMRRGRLIDIKCDTLSVTADNNINLSANNITLAANAEITENSAAHRINTGDYEAMEV